MPQKKIEIINVKIPIEIESQDPKVQLSKAALVKLDELANEQKVVDRIITNKKRRDKENLENIKRVFSILKEAFDRAANDKCIPESISGAKLIELYGKDISINSLTAKIRSYLRKNYNNNLILMKKMKNKKSAYILVQYGLISS